MTVVKDRAHIARVREMQLQEAERQEHLLAEARAVAGPEEGEQ